MPQTKRKTLLKYQQSGADTPAQSELARTKEVDRECTERQKVQKEIAKLRSSSSVGINKLRLGAETL